MPNDNLVLLNWVGGKSKLADQIIRLLPQHKRYVEPFFGGGWVFFSKAPAEENYINDINERLVNLYRVVRDNSEQLKRLLKHTPKSETEWNYFYDLYWNKPEEFAKFSLTEQAFMYFYVVRCSFNGMQKSFSSSTLPDVFTLIDEISKKLRNTVIYSRDYREILKDQTTKESVVYLDPPYAVATKKKYYEFNFTEEQHTELRDILLGANYKWVLSYDIHPLITELYSNQKGVHIHQSEEFFNSSVNQRAVGKAVFQSEYIITNFNIQESLPLFQ